MAYGERPATLTQIEFSPADHDFSDRIATALGFTQTEYTSTSALWGLFCLPDHDAHRHGCIIKTRELGFLFVADLEDLQLNDLADAEHRLPKTPAGFPFAPTKALERIQKLLSGKEWHAETCDAIAEVLRAAGYEINDFEP